MDNLKQLLDKEVNLRNMEDELSYDKPDPLFIAKRFEDEYVAFVCALFAYGNVHSIIRFLDSLDFSLLDKEAKIIKDNLEGFYYRFQSCQDVVDIFIALHKLKQKKSLEDIFFDGYKKECCVLEGIDNIIHSVSEELENKSEGLRFLVGKRLRRDKSGSIKISGNGAYKRYNMFLRWMVRKDNLDMGLWSRVDKKNLIIPLDTHTFQVSKKIGLLSRKTYDLKAAVLLTKELKKFDDKDPVKYDFALYRLGQERII
jgi:uncharacterized protein (TIGR02757 family)